MKKLLLIPLLLLIGCSHLTPYEKCNKEADNGLEWQRYGSLEECIMEKKAEAAKPNAFQRFSHGFSQGYNANAPKQTQRVHCTTDYTGGYNCQ